jgi:hypothetical protein
MEPAAGDSVCIRCAGDQQEQGLDRCEPVCCCRVTSGVLAAFTGSLFLLAAANVYGNANSLDYLVNQCGAVDQTAGGDEEYYYDGDGDGGYGGYTGYGRPYAWCDCDDVMPLTADGGWYGSDDCMLRYGTDEVQACCENAWNGGLSLSFIGTVLSFLAPFLVAGGWLPVCGVLGDCREAFASCNRVVTDEPAPCCWRDCTMIWVTPLWLLMLFMLPLHAVKSRDFDSGDNAGWLYWTVICNIAYAGFTIAFTIKPCVPPGHDAVSRRARLTGKLLNQCTCAAIGVFGLGLFFALIAFGFAEEQDFSMPCCYCVTNGEADAELLTDDPTGRCECRLTDEGTLVQTWMYDDYESSVDPNELAASQGTVSDGGDDMYDNGNYLSTSMCSGLGLAPYTTGMSVVNSECFGPHGQYRMDLRETMMVVVAKPSTDAASMQPWDFTVTGNLGADGSGAAEAFDDIPPRSGLKAFAKTVCSRTDPSITHLMVVEDRAPLPTHQWSRDTDRDDDELRSISPTSGFVYIMAAKEYDRREGRCPTRADIVALFESVVAMCTTSRGGDNTLSQGCGWLGWGGESGEAALVALEQSWTEGHSVAWDLDKLSPPPPPSAPKHCATPGVFYRFPRAASAPGAVGDYYYHVSNVYGGGRTGTYTGRHEWRATGGESISKTSRCGQQIWAIMAPASASSAYSEDSETDVDCWSSVGTHFETPPEVGWTCLRQDQALCDRIGPSRHGAGGSSGSAWQTLEGGLRLRSASFCIGDDMNATTSQCPGGDQSEALSDVSGAMDGWESCESGAATLALSRFGACGGQTTLVELLEAYLAAAQDTAETPQSMQEAGLSPLATFQDVCCETCPPAPRDPHGTFSPSPPSPGADMEPWQQQHSAPAGIHASSCPYGGNGGGGNGGRLFVAAVSTVASLLCINTSLFLMGHFQGCCCSRLGRGPNAVQTEGRCSMVLATVVAWVLLVVVDFFGFIMLIAPPPPEVVYILCVLLPSVAMLLMFNAHHCSLQAPVQTVQAVVTTAVMDFQMASPASTTATVVAEGSIVSPVMTQSPVVGVPRAHASAARQSAALMPSLGESLIPTTGFSLESPSGAGSEA